jgi:hypothetical protein
LEAKKQTAVRGDVEVQVTNARPHGKSNLLVFVKVSNGNKDKLLTFKGWSDKKRAALKDDKGNKYDLLRLSFSLEDDLKKQLAREKGDNAGFGPDPV